MIRFSLFSPLPSILKEIDMQWTKRYENVIGDSSRATTVTPQLEDASERVGPLWDLYRRLSKEGWALDARDYVTNFRVDVTKSTGMFHPIQSLQIVEVRKTDRESDVQVTFFLGNRQD